MLDLVIPARFPQYQRQRWCRPLDKQRPPRRQHLPRRQDLPRRQHLQRRQLQPNHDSKANGLCRGLGDRMRPS